MSRQQYTPRDYQERMEQHLDSNDRSALFVFPGAGKTPVTLSVLSKHKAKGIGGLTLVVAPGRVAESTWPGEAAQFENFKNLKVQSLVAKTAAKRAKLLAKAFDEKADVMTINPESFEALLKLLDGKWPFETLVIDEASRLRGLRPRQGTKRAKIIYEASKGCKYVYALTGSPAPNGLLGLFGLVYFLDHGVRLGKTFTSFTDRYFNCFELQGGGRIYNPRRGATEQVTDRIKDICMALRPEDVFKVDRAQIIERRINVPAEGRKHYDELAKESVTEKDGQAIVAVNSAVLANRLLQCSSGTLYAEDGSTVELFDDKLDALEEIAEELEGENLAVVVVYKADMERIKARFPKARELKTDADMQLWNSGKLPMILLQPASVGHGVSLQHGGRAVCFYNQLFDYELASQIAARLGPIRQAQSGYKRVVLQYHIISDKTYDDIAIAKLKEKEALENEVLRLTS